MFLTLFCYKANFPVKCFLQIAPKVVNVVLYVNVDLIYSVLHIQSNFAQVLCLIVLFLMSPVLGEMENNLLQQNKLLDARKVLENPRDGKSVPIQSDLNGVDEVINAEDDNHIDPVLDVISAFFGHDVDDVENIYNEKNGDQVNNDISNLITSDDEDIAPTAKQIPSEEGEGGSQLQRSGPRKARLLRDGRVFDVPGGLDFSNAVFDEKLGKLCMEKEEEIESVVKTPVLQCTHK